jgi:Raf kinase inhibitor-like YbhB/YbcL family protein
MKDIAMRIILTTVAVLLLGSAPAHAEMRLTSRDLTPGQPMANAQVFNQFGCKGANVSPELVWSGAPQGTRSFAILAFDPDAPTGSGWWHWVVFNIPASVDRVSTDASRSGALPHGAIQSRTDFGVTGYGGGCPPAGGGVHRYQFTVYALSVADLTTGDFPLDANAPSAMVSFVVHASALDHATVEVPYQR